MSEKKLVVAQIGCGAFAQSQHLPNICARKDLHLKYCCDVNFENAGTCAKKFGAEKALKNYQDALADNEVDFIMVATPHDFHLPIIQDAAARGIHVFCEKPMAMEIPEAWEIIRAVKRGNIKLCVDLNRRMAPSMHALRKQVLAQQSAPKHNPWRYVETDRDEFPEEKRTNFLIRVQDESSSYRMIHMDPQHGGGSIIGESVHWLDLACWFFAPQIPVEISAWGSTRMSHGINLVFSSGDSATIIFDVCGTFDYPKEMFEVTSRAALFRNMFFVENRYYGIPGVSSEKFPLQHDGFKDVVKEEGFDAFMKKCDILHQQSGGNVKYSSGDLVVDKGHQSMLAGFVEAIKNNTPLPCDEYAGLQSTLLAKLAIESIRLKRALPVLQEELMPGII